MPIKVIDISEQLTEAGVEFPDTIKDYKLDDEGRLSVELPEYAIEEE